MSDTVHAPWTPSQVRAIEAWQKTPTVHPLTCETSEHGPLFVTSEHLVCDTCGYEQTWVPTICAETFPSDHTQTLVPTLPQPTTFTGKVTPRLGDVRPLIDQVVERAVKQTADRVVALTIAIKLMEMHLEMATPDGAGRDSIAWAVAQGRLTVLRDLLEEIRATQPPQPT